MLVQITKHNSIFTKEQTLKMKLLILFLCKVILTQFQLVKNILFKFIFGGLRTLYAMIIKFFILRNTNMYK